MTTETPTTEAEVQPTTLSLLAAERLGQDFVGEVKQPEQLAETPQEQQENPQEQTVEEEVEALESTPDESAEDAPTEGDEGTEETPISSFSELVEHFDLDPEWAQSIQLDVKVNGEPGKASIADLVKSYQIQEAAEQRLNDAKEKASSITQEIAQQQEKLQEQLAVAASILDGEKQAIEKDEAEINWDQLKRIDPAEYSAKKLDIQERKANLDAKIQKASDQYSQAVRENQEKLEAEQRKVLEKESQALIAAIPTWKDPDVAKTEQTELLEYLVASGLTKEEASSILDHRQVVLARKAMLYDKSLKNTTVAKKKLIPVPKVLKPGASKPAETINQEKLAQAKQRLARSGNLDDALAAIKAARG